MFGPAYYEFPDLKEWTVPIGDLISMAELLKFLCLLVFYKSFITICYPGETMISGFYFSLDFSTFYISIVFIWLFIGPLLALGVSYLT